MATTNKALPPLPPLPLSDDITEDYIDCTSSCGLNFHILKSGKPGDPLILFTHGYPELAYSWRKILPAVAKEGYFCVAPDQRGYGRTTGWTQSSYADTDLSEYTLTNLVRDLVCLVGALNYTEVHSIIGHDFGAVASASAALIRPDMFKSTIQMSHPFHPPPSLPSSPPPAAAAAAAAASDIHADLLALNPPRKHYKEYHSSPSAASDYSSPPQGLEAFLRGYFHLKSADWSLNSPHALEKWSAEALSQMPEYYIMKSSHTMPETVKENMADQDLTRTERWLSKEDLQVYCAEWARTGFQGALNWYRAQQPGREVGLKVQGDMYLFSGRKIEVPVGFISGEKDWGNYQVPGALEGYEDERRVKRGMFRGVKMVEGAGHWVQQEQSESVVREVLGFLKSLE
ncbi:Alpha/Beta hydrolase protein [Cladorrhinum sp. PSN259]|nr:Alpha/Beta hydrolase protein [Cladorrhinum sp. PSN259]